MQQIFVQPRLEKHKNTPQQDDKNILGNIGDLFEKCIATSHKRPFVPSVVGIGLL